MTGIAVGLIKAGTAADVRFLLDLIASAKYKVVFWNVPLLASAMAQRADISLKPWLIELAGSPEFWEYIRDRPANALAVKYSENLYLFKRLSSTLLAGLCGKTDWPLLKRLLFHPYWSTKVAAASVASKFVTAREFDEAVGEARVRAGELPDEGLMHSLNTLDQTLYSD